MNNFRYMMSDNLNITLEEQNLEKILLELKGAENVNNSPVEEVDETEEMDNHGNFY